MILCGGAGLRLWPLSRENQPNPFAALIGDWSLFQAAVLRCSLPRFAPPLIVTGERFRFLVCEQLQLVGVRPAALLIDPSPKNTAPAILAAVLTPQAEDPTALRVALPEGL